MRSKILIGAALVALAVILVMVLPRGQDDRRDFGPRSGAKEKFSATANDPSGALSGRPARKRPVIPEGSGPLGQYMEKVLDAPSDHLDNILDEAAKNLPPPDPLVGLFSVIIENRMEGEDPVSQEEIIRLCEKYLTSQSRPETYSLVMGHLAAIDLTQLKNFVQLMPPSSTKNYGYQKYYLQLSTTSELLQTSISEIAAMKTKEEADAGILGVNQAMGSLVKNGTISKDDLFQIISQSNASEAMKADMLHAARQTGN